MAKATCKRCGDPFTYIKKTRPRVTCDACRRPHRGGESVYRWECAFCGKGCSRARVRGQVPKWCSQRCADLGKRGRRGLCLHCGSEFFGLGKAFCSARCVSRHSAGWSTCTDLVHVGPVPELVAPPTPTTVVTLPKWWGVIVNGPCAWCGEVFTGLSSRSRYCSKRCGKDAAVHRSGERFMVPPRFRYAIYQRDDWTCQLCFAAVDRDADPLSDWYPSLDHIVPQSRGGSDEWGNLRLTHRWCNAIRGDGRWHSDFFKVVTEGGALRVRTDGRSPADAPRSS